MRKPGQSVVFKGTVFLFTMVWLAAMLVSASMLVQANRGEYIPTTPFTRSVRLGNQFQSTTHMLRDLERQLDGFWPGDRHVELSQLPELAPSLDPDLYRHLIDSNLRFFYHNQTAGTSISNLGLKDLPPEALQDPGAFANTLMAQGYAFHQDFKQDRLRLGRETSRDALPPPYSQQFQDMDFEDDLQLTFVLDTGFSKADWLQAQSLQYAREQSWTVYEMVVLAAAALLFLLSWIFLIHYAGCQRDSQAVRLSWVDRIHGEFLAAGGLFLTLFIVLGWAPGRSFFGYRGLGLLLYPVAGVLFLSLVRRYRAGILFSQTIVGSLWILLRRFYENRPLFWKVAAAYAAYGFLALVCAIALTGSGFRALLALAALVLLPAAFVLLPLIRWSVQFEKVSQATDHMGLDTFQIDEPMDRLHPNLRRLVASLSSTHERTQRAIAEQMKSERLKTDLISNVSHDLKTPLTSIINYIDLLKQEQDDPEKREAYLEILDQKSQRLKNLTESLFEAAKASSGSLPVQREPVNLNELVQQVSGEYADRLGGSGLDLVLRIADDGRDPEGPERPATIELLSDGSHIWRILDNLMANVCKYALEGTRVYLDLQAAERFARIELKNISRDRLEQTGDELLQRFVRGDESRHQEGSGLGLSIASSLSSLLGGGLDIRTDGDLFKATVTLPLT